MLLAFARPRSRLGLPYRGCDVQGHGWEACGKSYCLWHVPHCCKHPSGAGCSIQGLVMAPRA